MEKASLYSRYILALLSLVFGANKFFYFMPMPAYAPGSPQMNYISGLSGVHLFEVLGVIYIISAILLATNKMVGLVTVVLAAIAFNFLLFHLTLDLANIPGALVFAAVLVVTMLGNKDKYQALLK